MNATRFERMTLWMSCNALGWNTPESTGITRATTAPRILLWITRYLEIPVACCGVHTVRICSYVHISDHLAND
jgi:hypothetical protein